jgi:hypothetical protein
VAWNEFYQKEALVPASKSGAGLIASFTVRNKRPLTRKECAAGSSDTKAGRKKNKNGSPSIYTMFLTLPVTMLAACYRPFSLFQLAKTKVQYSRTIVPNDGTITIMAGYGPLVVENFLVSREFQFKPNGITKRMTPAMGGV